MLDKVEFVIGLQAVSNPDTGSDSTIWLKGQYIIEPCMGWENGGEKTSPGEWEKKENGSPYIYTPQTGYSARLTGKR